VSFREIRDRLRFLCDDRRRVLTLAAVRPRCQAVKGSASGLPRRSGQASPGVLFRARRPSIGLHQPTTFASSTLGRLRDLGNTVIVVEHDEETIRTADWVIDLGPGAGDNGDTSIFQGSPRALAADDRTSLTGAYLRAKGRSRRREPVGTRRVITTSGRRQGQQPQGDHRPTSRSALHRGHRGERLGQVDARQRDSFGPRATALSPMDEPGTHVESRGST